MRKLRIIIAIFILAFSFGVKGEVLFEIDCNNSSINSEKKVTCEGNLAYETESITDISFDYSTNMDINFKNVPDFNIKKNGNHVTIHTDTPLYDEIMNVTEVMEFTLSYKDGLKDKEELVIKNIKLNNSISHEDIKQEFSISKEEKLDEINTLDSILVDNKKIDNFSKDKLEYDVSVLNEIIFIDSYATSKKSSVTGLGSFRVPIGKTKVFEIIVTSESGKTRIYKLNVTNKEEKKDEVKDIIKEKSKDNSLKTLNLFNGNERIEFNFDSNKSSYNIEVASDVEKITIIAVTNDSQASFVSSYAPRDVKIKYGSNKVLIKVKAENGDIKTYTLNIKRNDDRDNDNSLFYLGINGKEINLDNKNYEVTLSHDITKTEIKAIPNSEKAKVEYKDINLSDGNNKVLIKVTAENGNKKEYKVNVIRQEEIILPDIEEKEEIKPIITSTPKPINNDVSNKNTNSQTDSNLFRYVVIGLGIVSIITAIIFIVKKR